LDVALKGLEERIEHLEEIMNTAFPSQLVYRRQGAFPGVYWRRGTTERTSEKVRESNLLMAEASRQCAGKEQVEFLRCVADKLVDSKWRTETLPKIKETIR
jgi:hypothetical protein